MTFNPEWFSAVGDFVGGFGAAGAFLVAAGAYRTSTRDRHTSQARLVQPGFLKSPTDFDYALQGSQSLDLSRYAAADLRNELVSGDRVDRDTIYLEDDAVLIWPVIMNRSKEFVHDLKLWIEDENGDQIARLSLSILEPESTAALVAVVEPRASVDDMTLRLEFSDANGARWQTGPGRRIRLIRRDRFRIR